MSRLRLLLACVSAATTVTGLLACSGGSQQSGAHDTVIARVGHGAITDVELSHWIGVLAPQHVVPLPPRYAACIARQRAQGSQASEATLREECQHQYQSLQQQALAFLISSNWVTGEAAGEGIGVSAQEVKQRLQEKRKTFPGGAGEFERSLKVIAHTVPDVELEIETERATEKITQALSDAEPKITPAEIASYYKQHLNSFSVPELRYFDIAEFLKSKAIAQQIIREVKQGRSFAGMTIHEAYHRANPRTQGIKRPLYEALFAARPHVLVGPVRVRRLYFDFEITSIAPAKQQSLAETQAAIAQKLGDARRRRTLARFIAAWRQRWIAQTDCSAGYVVQKCRQYNGPTTPEDPLKLD